MSLGDLTANFSESPLFLLKKKNEKNKKTNKQTNR